MIDKVAAYAEQYIKNYMPYKEKWNYEDGCILTASICMYQATHDNLYRDFVLRYLDQRVLEDGSIPSFSTEQYSLDDINPGKSLFFALRETGNKKYEKAILFHMQRLLEHPRCDCGNFWHKEMYPYQIWLDGLYMAQPFYMAYEKEYDTYSRLGDISSQFINVRERMFDEEKKLYYHGYDEKRQQPWSSPETGLSSSFWLRAIGWYLMSLADCIELCSEQLYEHYRCLIDLLREGVRGILQYQEKSTHLFYQLVDHPELEGNYLETSGSAMIAYAILKGVRLHVLNDKYLQVGLDIYHGLTAHALCEQSGSLHLTGICKGAGLGPGNQRDGSAAYYLSEEIGEDECKGVAALMMAASEELLIRRKP